MFEPGLLHRRRAAPPGVVMSVVNIVALNVATTAELSAATNCASTVAGTVPKRHKIL